MNQDLSAFKDGISKEQFDIAVTKGTKYQVCFKRYML